MYSLKRLANQNGENGQPLPVQFETWRQTQVQFRRGATSMIAGVPGSFKSVLALNMSAWWAARQNLSVLYFSADSDRQVVKRRMSGILTCDTPQVVEARLDKNPHHYDRALATLNDFMLDDEAEDIEAIVDRIRAFEVIYGAYPEVIIADNLIDFADSPDDWAGMLLFVREMDRIARKTKAHVLVLHHAKIRTPPKNSQGENQRGREGWPPGDWEVSGKITQLSRMVITIAAEGRNMYWCPVKNTLGPQDREAHTRYGFFVTESMRIKDTGYRGSSE
jgi:RecA-family ATPase